MSAVPILLRRVLKVDLPEDDWAASQVAPDVPLVSTEGVKKIGCFYVARTATDAVANPSGTCDLQPLLVATGIPLAGHAPEVFTWAGATDTGVASGDGLTYDDLAQSSQFTLRVADDGSSLDAAVVALDIYWYAIA